MRMNFRIERLTNNGIVGYLNENEIRRFCNLSGMDTKSAARNAEESIRRSKHINTVIISKMTK